LAGTIFGLQKVQLQHCEAKTAQSGMGDPAYPGVTTE